MNEYYSPLVAATRHLLQPNGSILGKDVLQVVQPHFATLLDALGPTCRLQSMDGHIWDATQIRERIEYIGTFLHKYGLGQNDRVAVVLPNGPHLALCILGVANYCTCVPLNPYAATQELQTDLRAVSIALIICSDDDATNVAAAAGNQPYAVWSDNMQLTMMQPPPSRLSPSILQPNTHQNVVLLLFTSGTTGSKKLVPHTWCHLLVATACICVSWNLTVHDVNGNAMPLFHIGGIVRQVLSPLCSGGTVIVCPSFDPHLFWTILQNCTWYYAAPTMHQLLLQSRKPKQQHTVVQLRMIANAAGGLLPSLARELAQTFSCTVLPSYGMTECMPISSPPYTYSLSKPGTSGVSVGPELAILRHGHELARGTEGPICVRGPPLFHGYLAENNTHFQDGGWFDTGDLGYMDVDGYLYITGRSKEVINRGGEIISPLEVEEACLGHAAVQACVAFSSPHAVLQEVVGLVVVPVPGKPNVDLPTLHEYLGDGRLAAPKWPQCLVYMNALPKSHTNKLLRVKLGRRLGLPEIRDKMVPMERTYQATCPEQGTPVSVAISCERLTVQATQVQEALRRALQCDTVWVTDSTKKLGALVCYAYQVDRVHVIQTAQATLDAYAVPTHVVSLSSSLHPEELCTTPPEPSDAVASILQEATSQGAGPTDSLVMELQELVQVLLDLDCLPSEETNFFNLGGSSMLASQLASRIRKLYGVAFGGAEVFHHRTCRAMAAVIRERQEQGGVGGGEVGDESTKDPASQAASSLFSKKLDLSRTPFDPNRMDIAPTVWSNIFQLVPLFVIYPVWYMTRFFLFFRCLLWALVLTPEVHNLYKFVLTLVMFHLLWVTFTPLLFVLIKWTIIGKYRQGRYAIYSEYYLRWWMVDVFRKLTGLGIWGSNELLLATYYRLLGATIGKGARISLQADVAEFDLVSIGEQAAVEASTVRAFGVDNGCMILGPVRVGHKSSVGAGSVVAPHTEIPDGADLGPATSSYEINSTAPLSDTSHHLRYNRQALPEPFLVSQILFVGPILFVVNTMSHMPAFLVLYRMIEMPWHHDEPFESMGDLMEWLCDVRRIPFYIGIRVVRSIVAPLVYMFCAILVKWFVIGKFRPGPRDSFSEWELTRHFLAAELFSREKMQDCTELLGRHYELISVLYRLLGAKVGKRVFWPGHQPGFSGEFDLLEIGDDVVFGSRASIFCTTTDSCEKVILCAGANVSDNTVVLPGSILGKNAVLGSNSVCPAGRYLPEQSVWFGARQGEPVVLEKGPGESSRPIEASEVYPEHLQMEGDETTLRPFGRAYQYRDTPYFLLPVWFMIVFTWMTRICIATLHTLPVLGALHLAKAYVFGWDPQDRDYDNAEVSSSSMYTKLLLAFMVTHFVSVAVWYGIEVLSKWSLLGKRQEGRYNYDESSYGQLWELYQIITKVRFSSRLNIMDFFTGTPYMAAFFRALGMQSGDHCCLYPTGGDPYMPEPDLVHMGDRCVVDRASIVCHLNTRGNFELATIRLDNTVTLRTRSRIQQAVHMEENSMLLEKSLALTGEVIEADSVWVGAPAVRLFSYDTSSINTVSYNGSQTSHTGQFV